VSGIAASEVELRRCAAWRRALVVPFGGTRARAQALTARRRARAAVPEQRPFMLPPHTEALVLDKSRQENEKPR